MVSHPTAVLRRGAPSDHAGFAAQADLARRKSAELRLSIDELRSCAAELAPLWQGSGVSAFLAIRMEWERAATEIEERLTGMEILLDRAGSADAGS